MRYHDSKRHSRYFHDDNSEIYNLYYSKEETNKEPISKENEILTTIKMWLQIILFISPFVGCTYWLDQDDKRMMKSYIAKCELRKEARIINADTICKDEFWKAYKDALGR